MTYVCYRNGEVEFIGSAEEVISRYGWKGGRKTLSWYATPSAARRGDGCFSIEKVEDE